jgi:Txe/YoeB family toxin of Txe-Axe toxin-antitoxin module
MWVDTNKISKKLDEIVNEIRKDLNFTGEWKFEIYVRQNNVYRSGYATYNDEIWFVVQENGKLLDVAAVQIVVLYHNGLKIIIF